MSIPIDSKNGSGSTVTGDMIQRVERLRLGNQLAAVKQRSGGGRSWLPWILCGLLATAWAGVGIRSYRATASAPAAQGTAPSPTPSTSTGQGSARTAASEPGSIVLQLKASIIPSLQIAVSPDDVGARVVMVNFYEGKIVKKGELLAQVLNTRYDNDFRYAEAALQSANSRVTELEAALESARAKLHEAVENLGLCQRKLKRFDKSNSSEQDIDEARTNQEVMTRRKFGAEQDLVAAERRLASAKQDRAGAMAKRNESERLLKNCSINAPIDGTVLTKKADIGSRVDASAFNLASTLCEIADLSRLEVEVDVAERDITRVKAGQECQIAADADPSRVYRAKVDRIMPIADDSKNVVKVRLRLYLPKGEKPGEFLRPKMSVVATILNKPFTPSPADQTWDDAPEQKAKPAGAQ